MPTESPTSAKVQPCWLWENASYINMCTSILNNLIQCTGDWLRTQYLFPTHWTDNDLTPTGCIVHYLTGRNIDIRDSWQLSVGQSAHITQHTFHKISTHVLIPPQWKIIRHPSKYQKIHITLTRWFCSVEHEAQLFVEQFIILMPTTPFSHTNDGGNDRQTDGDRQTIYKTRILVYHSNCAQTAFGYLLLWDG